MSKLPEAVQEMYPNAELVAEVKVFIDSKSEASSGAFPRLGGESYIVLSPNGRDKIKTKEQLFVVLAHELGHWIAVQRESPTINQRARVLHKLTGDGRFVLPNEREAWDWAEKIIPDLDQAMRKEALKTYGDTSFHARMV